MSRSTCRTTSRKTRRNPEHQWGEASPIARLTPPPVERLECLFGVPAPGRDQIRQANTRVDQGSGSGLHRRPTPRSQPSSSKQIVPMGTFCRRPGRTACVIAPSAAKPLALPSPQQPALSPGQFVGAEPGPRQGVDNLLLRRNGGPFHHLSALEPTACQDRKLRRTVLTLFLASLRCRREAHRPSDNSGRRHVDLEDKLGHYKKGRLSRRRLQKKQGTSVQNNLDPVRCL